MIYHTKLLVAGPSTSGTGSDITGHRDDSFREFRRLCAEIAEESSYLAKTKLVHDFINKGSSGGIYNFFYWPMTHKKKNTRKHIVLCIDILDVYIWRCDDYYSEEKILFYNN